jgi:hypothetical protein
MTAQSQPGEPSEEPDLTGIKGGSSTAVTPDLSEMKGANTTQHSITAEG